MKVHVDCRCTQGIMYMYVFFGTLVISGVLSLVPRPSYFAGVENEGLVHTVCACATF